MKTEEMPIVVGVMSRLDYGPEDHRAGLWRLAAQLFREHRVNMVVIAGGLVDGRALTEELRTRQAVARAARGNLADVESRYAEDIAGRIAKLLPELDDGVKYYLTTSEAYDGKIGQMVADHLCDIRLDVLHSRNRERHEMKGGRGVLGVLTPERAAWLQGDYYETPVRRVLGNQRKRGRFGVGDINIVGCFASNILNPGDSTEVQRPYISAPALARIGRVRTAENQVGVVILEIPPGNKREVRVVSYDFKGLFAREGQLIRAPKGSTKTQEAIVGVIGMRGGRTIGQLEDELGIARDKLTRPLRQLVARKKSKYWPGLVLGASDRRYSFSMKSGWFQRFLDYPAPNPATLTTHRFAGFGCLHAGCRWTDMLWFRDELPEALLAEQTEYLVGIGDFIEGLKHNLMLRGELVGLLNYSEQEKLAAYLVSSVILAVFAVRFAAWLAQAQGDGASVSPEALRVGVVSSLIHHIFRSGNHCCWVEDLGFHALDTYERELRVALERGVRETLEAAGLALRDLGSVVAERVTRVGDDETHLLPSGLLVSLHHPSMARTKTPSIRLQEALNYSPAAVVFSANFHTGEVLHEYDPGKGGQRVCLQAGTMKVTSGFEKGKLKIVDTGVGFLEVTRSGADIWRTVARYRGTAKKPIPALDADNRRVLADFYKKYGR